MSKFKNMKIFNYNYIWKVAHVIAFAVAMFFLFTKCFCFSHPLDVHILTPEEEASIKKDCEEIREAFDDWNRPAEVKQKEADDKESQQLIDDNKPQRDENGEITYE